MTAIRALSIVAPLILTLPPAAERSGQIEGVWRYQFLQRAGESEAPVIGVIAFVGGHFVQQSLNSGEPFDLQLFQAHAGTYEISGDALTMKSTVGLLVQPSGQPMVESRRDAEHRVRVRRSGADLTLVFGTGTIQRLVRSAMPTPQMILLSRGALLLGGDGRFSMTAERDDGAVAGWGRYRRDSESLVLDAERWLTLQGRRPEYARDSQIRASLSDRMLTLPGGRSFAIQRGRSRK
jgi:hypothetical protein